MPVDPWSLSAGLVMGGLAGAWWMWRQQIHRPVFLTPPNKEAETGTAPNKDAVARVAALTQTARSLAKTSADLMASAEQTADRAQAVAVAAEQVGANTMTVSAGAEEMTAAISEIATTTQEAARISGDARMRSKQVDEAVQRLGKSSADIGAVVKAIAGIAEQTNLLALNATI